MPQKPTPSHEECEVKFLDVNAAATEQKLLAMDAAKQFDRLYRRYVFDFPGWPLDAQSAWLRLRDEGDSVKLSFKQRLGTPQTHGGQENDAGMKEIEITVSDFDKTAALLLAIGMEEKFYEENRRIRYTLGDIEFDLDSWPMIPPYLEIEAPSWEQVERAIALLGLNPEDRKIMSTMQVYALYGIREKDYRVITFERRVER